MLQQGLAHVFFNGNNHFEGLGDQRDWQGHYIGPYDSAGTFAAILSQNGFATVNAQSWHFGAQAHEFWAHFLLRYLRDHDLIRS